MQTLSKKTIVGTTRWQSATGGPAFAGAPIPRVTREATGEPEVRSIKMMRLLDSGILVSHGVPWFFNGIPYPTFRKQHMNNPYQAAQAPVAPAPDFPEIVAKSGPERDCIGSGVDRDRLAAETPRIPSVPAPAQETKELSFVVFISGNIDWRITPRSTWLVSGILLQLYIMLYKLYIYVLLLLRLIIIINYYYY